MNSHEFNCCSSDEWHQNLLEGCNDVVHRLTHVVNILSTRYSVEIPVSHRLRLVGQRQEARIPATLNKLG